MKLESNYKKKIYVCKLKYIYRYIYLLIYKVKRRRIEDNRR